MLPRIPFVNYGEMPSPRFCRDIAASIRSMWPSPGPGNFLTVGPCGASRRMPQQVNSSDIGVLFAVTVAQTGGAAGSSAAGCSFTYTVTSLGGLVLGTSISPQNSPARIVNVSCNVGSVGAAYWNVSGTSTMINLMSVNETAFQNNCS